METKLQKKLNTHFCWEAAEYLEVNGFKMSEGDLIKETLYFVKGDKAVVIYNDNADFLIHHGEEPEQRAKGFSRHMSITGISHMTLLDWIFQLHVGDMVPLQQFIKGVIREGVRVEAEDLLGALFPLVSKIADRSLLAAH